MNAKFIPFFPQKFNSKARNWLMIPPGMLLAKLTADTAESALGAALPLP
jgi:hypothetical protein